MALGTTGKPVVTEWILDNKGVLINVAKQAKLMRAEKKAERELAMVTKQLGIQQGKTEKSTKKMSKATAGMSKGMAKAALAAGAVAAGLTKAAAAMGDAITQAKDYEDWIGKDTTAIRGMRKASAGLISDLQIMKARTRLLNGDFKLTEEQLQAVTKAAIHYTRINKTSFTDSLNKVTDTIQRGTARGMKMLGFNINLAGKASMKTSQAVDMITSRFGAMNIEAVNTNERLAQVKNVFNNMVGQIGTAILTSDGFTGALTRMANRARQLLKGWETTQGTQGKITELGEHMAWQEKRIADTEKIIARGKTWYGRAMGAGKALQGNIAAIKQYRKLYEAAAKKQHALIKLRRLEKQQAKWGTGDFKPMGPTMAELTQKTGKRGRVGTGARRRRRKTGLQFPQKAYGGPAVPTTEEIGVAWQGPSQAAQAVDAETVAFDAGAAAAKRHADAVAEAGRVSAEASATFQSMAVGSLANLTGGLWAAADAAIQGGQAMGAALAGMLKSVLLSVAQEATIKAIMQTAEGIAAQAMTFGVPNPKSVAHFSAAATYGVVAAAAGGAGLGLSAAGAGASGGGAKGGGGGGMATPSTKSFAKEVVDKRPQFINVYVGDPGSRSNALLMQKELKASVTS